MKRSVTIALGVALAAALSFVAGNPSGAAYSTVKGTGNGSGPVKTLKAAAKLESRSSSTVTGEAVFTQKSGGVEISVDIKGAKPGVHGIHLHEKGDCSAADASSAGGHFNPENKNHGSPTADPHHAGDFGNIKVGADGTGSLRLTVKGLTVAPGPDSVVGHAVVVHADQDDLKSQPAGNSGARVACGVVRPESK